MDASAAKNDSVLTVRAGGEIGNGLLTGLELMSLMSSWSSGPAVTSSAMTTQSEMAMDPEKPLEEYLEVKIAVWIDRLYLPLIVAVGVLGNFLCFVTLLFTSLRTTSTCVYMAAIAVLDSVILVTVLCFLISGYVGDTWFYLRRDWTCGLHYFLFFFSIHFDVLILLAMTVDRFVVVRFPLKAQRLCTPKSALKTIAGLGFFSFALNVQILFNRGLVPTRRPEDPLWCWYPDADVKFFMKKVYTWIDASIYSFLPFLSMLVLNILIIRQLKQSAKFSQQFTEQRDATKPSSKTDTSNTVTVSRENENNASKTEPEASFSATGESNANDIGEVKSTTTSSSRRKAAANTNVTFMLLLVSFTFLLLTSPTVIMLLYKRYYWLPRTTPEKAKSRLTHAVLDNLMYSNHAINFLLYCISGRRFRHEFQRLLARFCRCRRS